MEHASTPTEQLEGTVLVVGAAMVFALVALVVKVDPLPLLPATECRFAVSWVVSVAFMLSFRRSRGLHWFGPPGLRHLLLLKCAVSFGFITLWWAALRRAPVGDCIAIIYCSPIFTSVFSLFILGEALHREFVLQVLLVAVGTICILNPPLLRRAAPAWAAEPSAAEKGDDYTLVFLALVLCATAPIITRWTRACSWIEVEHVNALLASAVLNPLLILAHTLVRGTPPELPAAAPREAVLIVIAALGSFAGIAMETKGYQLAEPGKASMFRYVEVPFAYVLQHFGTSTPVSVRAATGALLIVVSCAVGAAAQRARTPPNGDVEGDAAEALLGPHAAARRANGEGSASI